MIHIMADFPFAECGLDGLSEQDRAAFAKDLLAELELRVGARLTRRLTAEQLDEFGVLSQGSEASCRGWLERHLPGYQSSPAFRQLLVFGDSAEAHRETAVSEWMRRNVPSSRAVTALTRRELFDECVYWFNHPDA